MGVKKMTNIRYVFREGMRRTMSRTGVMLMRMTRMIFGEGGVLMIMWHLLWQRRELQVLLKARLVIIMCIFVIVSSL